MVKFHTIDNYAYSYTLTNNDFAAKLSLWKGNSQKVADIYFMYEGQAILENNIQEDSEYGMLYLPVKTMPGIIDMLRNEKPLSLTLNPPFAFLGTDVLEQVGDGEPNVITSSGGTV